MSVRWILLSLSYDVVRICPSRAIDGYSTKIRRGILQTQDMTVSRAGTVRSAMPRDVLGATPCYTVERDGQDELAFMTLPTVQVRTY